MKFKTVSGSSYEVDLWNRRCRRLEGKGPPTPRQSQDMVWKDYVSISLPTKGARTLFVWNENGHATATGEVVEITEETDSDRSFFKGMIAALETGGAAC